MHADSLTGESRHIEDLVVKTKIRERLIVQIDVLGEQCLQHVVASVADRDLENAIQRSRAKRTVEDNPVVGG